MITDRCDVVTWRAPRGECIDLCHDCHAKLAEAGKLPKTELGEDYCGVRQGMHRGFCNHAYWAVRTEVA